jgi:K+ transporter
VISGAFWPTGRPADYLARLRVIHTSEREYGQVYVPTINWVLMGAVLALVVAFQSSAKLAFAFGMEVTGTIAITTILFLSPIDTRDTSFYLSKVELKIGDGRGMRRWRKRLFFATTLIGAEPADSFRLPRERTITIGSEIEF